MPAPPDKQMLGGDGVMRFIASGTTIPTASGYLFDYVLVNTPNTTVSGVTDENNVNVSVSGEFNLDGQQLQTGVIIIGKNGARIKGISVTAGSVIGYQSRDRGNLRL
jgi:hypothetical protein